MMKNKLRKEESKKSFVWLKINLDRLKLELQGEDASSCLEQVSKILDKISSLNKDKLEDLGFDYPIENMLSDELLLNSKVTKMLNNYSQIYQDYRTNRVAIQNKRVVELEKGKVEDLLDFEDVKKAVNRLLSYVNYVEVKHAIIHIKGGISQQEAKKIVDYAEQELSNSEIHTIFTRSEVPSHTIVEGIFFGDFDDTEFEDD